MDEFAKPLAFIEDLEERAASRIEALRLRARFLHRRTFPSCGTTTSPGSKESRGSWRELRRMRSKNSRRRPGLPHRKIHFRDEEWVDDICNKRREATGWEAERLIFMIRHQRGREAGTGAGPARSSTAPSGRYGSRSPARQPWAHSEDDIRQVLEANRTWMSLVGRRYFAVEAEGQLVAAADLYRGPGLAQVEDV